MIAISGWGKRAICVWASDRPSHHYCRSWTPSDTFLLWICMSLNIFDLKFIIGYKFFSYALCLYSCFHIFKLYSCIVGWSHDSGRVWCTEERWISSAVDGAPKSGSLLEKPYYLLNFFHAIFLLLKTKYINACGFPLFLQKWMEIIGQAHQNVDFLKDQDVIRTVLNILQV